MNKAQTDSIPEAPAAPEEERTARHLRVFARMIEIGMEVAEATRTEAVEAPQPGVDYSQRISAIFRAVRLTALLGDKFARQREERRRAAAIIPVATWHRQRVRQAMVAAVHESSETAEEAHRRGADMVEQLERPELAELVELYPAQVAVARLCRMFGLPPEAGRWVDMADEVLEDLGRPDPSAPPRASPEPRSAGVRRRKSPDTG
ncbi:MAG: hypothetical protein ACRC67_27460 [Inquilinus sp.]|uniref:hypothetical protein n=1 Tax=Inquilinus sp. TaxID=1932117 RepID=UPI003F3F1B5D